MSNTIDQSNNDQPTIPNTDATRDSTANGRSNSPFSDNLPSSSSNDSSFVGRGYKGSSPVYGGSNGGSSDTNTKESSIIQSAQSGQNRQGQTTSGHNNQNHNNQAQNPKDHSGQGTKDTDRAHSGNQKNMNEHSNSNQKPGSTQKP
ncbi:MAG TPA: hypothetical protein VFH95_05045 [Candidatus Kapabacteria bacterium]|nr:hypothetical protein [Candidatus Kapabacteria bacterium]